MAALQDVGACSRAGGTHTAFCKARFNGLIRVDRIASGGRTPRTPCHEPMTPFASPPTPAVEDSTEPVAPEETEIAAEARDEYEGVAAEDLPFSAGVPPDKGTTGKIISEVNERFIDSDQLQNRRRRVSDLSGRNVLFEYACSDDSIIGQKSRTVWCKCLGLGTLQTLNKLLDSFGRYQAQAPRCPLPVHTIHHFNISMRRFMAGSIQRSFANPENAL